MGCLNHLISGGPGGSNSLLGSGNPQGTASSVACLFSMLASEGRLIMWRRAWTPGRDISISPELSIYKIGTVIRKVCCQKYLGSPRKVVGGWGGLFCETEVCISFAYHHVHSFTFSTNLLFPCLVAASHFWTLNLLCFGRVPCSPSALTLCPWSRSLQPLPPQLLH